MSETERLARIAQLRAELAALEASDVAPMAGPLTVLRDTGVDLYAKECASAWAGTPLETINKLKPDSSGKLGELFVAKLCRDGGLTVEYNEDINDQDDGTYDAVLNGKRVEIKTARLGAQHGFQHESLRADGCDLYLFVDIVPDAVYLTVSQKFVMTERHPIFGRKPHLRKGTTDVYKFDFGLAHLELGRKAGITLKVDATTTAETIVEFLRTKLV